MVFPQMTPFPTLVRFRPPRCELSGFRKLRKSSKSAAPRKFVFSSWRVACACCARVSPVQFGVPQVSVENANFLCSANANQWRKSSKSAAPRKFLFSSWRALWMCCARVSPVQFGVLQVSVENANFPWKEMGNQGNERRKSSKSAAPRKFMFSSCRAVWMCCARVSPVPSANFRCSASEIPSVRGE